MHIFGKQLIHLISPFLLFRICIIVRAGANVSFSTLRLAQLFSQLNEIEESAYELTMFDSLNAIYETQFVGKQDWRAAIIRLVYEKLSVTMSSEPDYWLQRAKAIYYMSGDPNELRIAVAYCEKGIIEKKEKTWLNAKLSAHYGWWISIEYAFAIPA